MGPLRKFEQVTQTDILHGLTKINYLTYCRALYEIKLESVRVVFRFQANI